MTPFLKRGFLMRKKILLLGLIITLISIAVIFFIRCSFASVLFSLHSALQEDSTFAYHNYITDDVYILQTNNDKKTLTLYRKQADGSLLRYALSEDSVTSDVTKNGQWQLHSCKPLPDSPFLLADEICALLKGKSDSTYHLKTFADFLLSSISGIYNDSSILIDYKNLPNVIQATIALIKNNNVTKELHIDKQLNTTNIICNIVLFENEAKTEQIISILSDAIQPMYRDTIYDALTDTCNHTGTYCIRIKTSILGNFSSIEIYNNSETVYTIEKLK